MSGRLGRAGGGVLLLTVAAGVQLASTMPRSAAQESPAAGRGRTLYEQGCATCHGVDGGGTAQGPSLRRVGPADVDFYLSTGRMPLANGVRRAVRKPPAYDAAAIADLVAYIDTFADGQSIPAVDPGRGELAKGGELFRANCASCHSYAGSGGALSNGRAAPTLRKATDRQVAEAVRIGPGAMPVFSERSLDQADLDSVTRYVGYLRNPPDRGGLDLGNKGPIPEGFMAWFVGLAALLGVAFWVGTRE
jgi:ubiquinol-cytochrome c reductase cytochrome c subunit